MSRVFVHDGTRWVSRPNALQAHDGNRMQANANVWMHDGTRWVLGSQRPYVMVNVPVNNNLTVANRRWQQSIPGTGAPNFPIRIEFQVMETDTSRTPARSRIRFNLWLESVGNWATTATGQDRTFRIRVRRNNGSGTLLHTIETTNRNQNIGVNPQFNANHGRSRHFISNHDRWIDHNANGSLTIAVRGEFDGPRLSHNTALWAIPWTGASWTTHNVFGTRQEKRYV